MYAEEHREIWPPRSRLRKWPVFHPTASILAHLWNQDWWFIEWPLKGTEKCIRPGLGRRPIQLLGSGSVILGMLTLHLVLEPQSALSQNIQQCWISIWPHRPGEILCNQRNQFYSEAHKVPQGNGKSARDKITPMPASCRSSQLVWFVFRASEASSRFCW